MPQSGSSKMDPLDRWLSGEAIQPKSLSNWERALQWMRQHPGLSCAAAGLIIAALAIPIASLVAYARAAESLRLAAIERENAVRESVNLSAAVLQKADELKQQEIRLQNQLRERQELENSLRRLHANYDQSQQQCLAADKRLQDALREVRLSMAEDFSRQAQELQRGLPEISLVLAAKALSITQQEGVPPIPIAFQQVHDLLAPTDGVELHGHEGPVAQLAASRDGNWLASGDHQGLVRLWNATSRNSFDHPRLLDGHWGRVTQLVFTADNRWLVSGSTDSTAHLWQLDATDNNTGPILLKNNQRRIVALTASDGGRWLAIAHAGQVTNEIAVRMWDLQAKNIPTSFVDLPSYQGQLCSLAVSRYGDWVATGNEDGTVRLWRLNAQTGAVTGTDLRMHNEPVRAIRFAPDGRSLITAAGRQSGKGTIRAWSLESADTTADAVLADSSNGVELFAMTSDGRWLFTANDEPSLRVRDLAAQDGPDSGTLLAGQTSAVQAMALSANERWLATAGTDNTVRLWYLSAKGPTATPITIRTPQGLITSVAFAGKGDWLATGNDRGNIQLWNLRVDDLIRMANARMPR
jgi:WD40 repeat protein